MDDQKARGLLSAERARVQELLDRTNAAGQEDRAAALQPGDMTDPSEPLIREEEQDEVSAVLQERLEAIKRAEQRLADGSYGRSVRSGVPIPDDRLEADPAAELTVEEAEENR